MICNTKIFNIFLYFGLFKGYSYFTEWIELREKYVSYVYVLLFRIKLTPINDPKIISSLQRQTDRQTDKETEREGGREGMNELCIYLHTVAGTCQLAWLM